MCSQVPRNICLFLPKFHCELNWIERYWGAANKYARNHCSYTLAGLRAIIPLALSQSLDEIPEEMRGDPSCPCPLCVSSGGGRAFRCSGLQSMVKFLAPLSMLLC